jgi:5-methylcytosine-specific restriction protein A
MALRSSLTAILQRYPKAKAATFKGSKLAEFVRNGARVAIREAMGIGGDGLIAEGSAGAGNWAAVSWIAVFDPSITECATRGYYVVHLFHATEPVVHLSLNHGTTTVREEFGRRAREVLRDRADAICSQPIIST